MSENKLSVIWNVTGKCPWTCTFCCMDSGPKNCMPEMTLEEKFLIANQLGANGCRVDLSGGEVMLNRKDHLLVIERLWANLGRRNLGISCSGAFIDEKLASWLAPKVSDVEMTMDAHPDRNFPWRPAAYHQTAARAAKALLAAGVKTGLQTVTTNEHKAEGLLEELYAWICDAGIDNWSILKFFPSGRGVAYPELELSDEDAKEMVTRIRALDAGNTSARKPKLDIHYQMPGSEKASECRCVKRSIGILPDGRVTACFWGLDMAGRFLDDKFYLGNLLKENLGKILSSPKARYWLDYCGGCAIGDDAAD
ncbi:radical SAM protein [Leadbettera azotonutricia]|uniref:Putative radical SAM domain protein n=1 Tax=Leadbettera azotonutricia (strain ATCC BAA-888 / DSM 13862 / ZAS-9) TaxID=545695 RepID=F5YD14_LEAAZ|nr:radical SAM protein [Leadbettera azotonutricia]AEF81237.1 putative radical SAM domain protein [Leadbettera azotonutricia ZAS-9]